MSCVTRCLLAIAVPRDLQVARLSTIFFESKLMGAMQPNGDTLFPYVWSWKKPGFTNPCATLIQSRAAGQTALLRKYPGYQDVRRRPSASASASCLHR